ncbi:MAG: protein BatD [Candidatus Aureabacteria bacterium]|nr:protein BatD [Candidatus Auribacterota bacterium]
MIESKKIVFCIILLLAWKSLAFSDDIRFEATVDSRTVALGESLNLNLSLHGTQDASPPDIGEIDGFQTRYLGPSTRMSIVNGRVSTSITYIYSLTPLKTGSFQIGPFSVSYKGKTYSSEPINIEVVSSSVSQRPESHTKDKEKGMISEEKLKDRIFLTIESGKTDLYVNETVPLSIKLYVNRLAIQDIQYPKFNHEGFSVKEFFEPDQYRQTVGDVSYDVIEFHTDIFPVKPGDLVLGPAQVDCNIVIRKQQTRRRSSFNDDFFKGFFDDDIFDNFFDRYETYPFQVKSPPLSITVHPLPEEGRPDSFKGAIGQFRLEVEAAPKEVIAGDPVTLKMVVGGKGNLDAVVSPVLSSQEGLKVYEPEVRQEGDAKVFEQVLIPMSEKVSEIPEITFSFFDPQRKEYQVLTRGPFPITVEKTQGGELRLLESPQGPARVMKEETLGRDIVYIKESPGKWKRKGKFLFQSAIFWIYNLAVFTAFIVLLTSFRHHKKLRTDLKYARRLHASTKARKGIAEARKLLKQKKSEEFFDMVHKTLHGYLSDKFHLPAGRVSVEVIREILGGKNIEEGILKKMEEFFGACDMARYAPSEFDEQKRETLFNDMCEVIDDLERRKV